NEEESISELSAWIHQSLENSGLSFEIIFADDGSRDHSWKVIRALSEKHANVKGICFRRNYGKSAALNEGFKMAIGKVVITMDADLQDSPEEIIPLYKMITEEGFDLVSGWKKKRYDPITKTIPTKLFNGVTSLVSGIEL